MAELTPFLPRFFPPPEISSFWGTSIAITSQGFKRYFRPRGEEVFDWVIFSDLLPLNDPDQRRSSRPQTPQLGGGGPRPTLGAQVSLKLLFGYVTIFSSADLFTTDLNCRKKLACDIISECDVILSRRI